MSSLVVAGAALAAFGMIGRNLMKRGANMSLKYYRGGFDPVMTRREASLILGVSPNSPTDKVKLAHKKIMLLNHPDRGGSPYIATKINEAKDVMDK